MTISQEDTFRSCLMGILKLINSSLIIRYPMRQAIPEVKPNGVILSVNISPGELSGIEVFLG